MGIENMRDEQHARRLDMLVAIAGTTSEAVAAAKDRDFDRLEEISVEREQFFAELSELDEVLSIPAALDGRRDGPRGLALIERAQDLIRRIVREEARLRECLDEWRLEMRDEVVGFRQKSRARSSYARLAGAAGAAGVAGVVG